VPADYSTTPLATKLGLKERHRLVLVHAPAGWTVGELPVGVRVLRRRTGHADVLIAFFHQLTVMEREVAELAEAIESDGSLWLAWPRRAGGHTSDITDNEVRRVVLPFGLVDVKVAALDENWSALKMVWRKERRSRRPTDCSASGTRPA
jgi:hypothetical protein